MHIFHTWGKWSMPEQTTLGNMLGYEGVGMVQHHTCEVCGKTKMETDMTNPQKPKTPSFSKDVSSLSTRTTEVADDSIPASTVGLEGLRELWLDAPRCECGTGVDGNCSPDKLCFHCNNFFQAIMQLMTGAEIAARVDEVEKALQAGAIRTVPTDKGNDVEWWPDGLHRTLSNRLAQLADLQRLQQGKGGEK